MFISASAKVNLARNQAKELGGAIYVSNPRNTYMCGIDTERVVLCSIQVLPDSSSEDFQLFSITFNQNKAGVAGNAIYGDKTSACLLKSRDDFCSHCPFPEIYQYNGVNDTSDLFSFTSDPTRVCFCENGIPDFYRVLSNRAVHPGERFYLSLALVGYGLGTVPGSVIARGRGNVSFGNTLENIQEVKEAQCQDVGYSIVSKNDREIALAVDTLSFTISLEKVNLVVDPLKYTDNIDFLWILPTAPVQNNYSKSQYLWRWISSRVQLVSN